VRFLSILSVRIKKCAKGRELFAENKVRFARAKRLWCYLPPDTSEHRRHPVENNDDVIRTRDVKSSGPKWPRGQNFGLGLGLGLKALASVSALASNIWPRPGLGLQQKNQQPRRDRLTNLFVLYFADYRTSHYDRR